MPDSNPESEPLNPGGPQDSHDLEHEARDIDFQANPPRDPLHILILYALSCALSIGGVGCGIWGYSIVRTAPFDKYSKKMERESYESNFLGMQSVIVFVHPTLPTSFCERS
jgi:hypothetical protein